MKRILILLLICFMALPCFGWGRKAKPVLILSNSAEGLLNNDAKFVFDVNSKIYFSISNPNGFKSDYIKYQIIKQDDKAHIGGYTRIRNVTCRVKNKYSYTDYFTVLQKGKYFIQVFDITNLQQWLAIEGFMAVD